MSRKRETVYLQGKVYWAKVLGTPRMNYEETGREWTFEFEPDEQSIATLAERGLADRCKDRRIKQDGTPRKGYENRAPFMYMSRDEFDSNGRPNDPIRIVNAANQPWNDKTYLGNETLVDLKVNIVDYGKGKHAGIYPQAIRVLELVPYVSEEFAPLDEDDPRVKAARQKTDDFNKDFGLEDEPEPEVTPATEPEENAEAELNDELPPL